MRQDDGSAVAEFVMVAVLLVVLTLSVVQLGIALLIRNTLIDAAAEGARFGSLADATAEDGVRRTIDLISTAIGPDYASDVTARMDDFLGHTALAVTVRAPLPVLGLVGLPEALEVTGHAAVEVLR